MTDTPASKTCTKCEEDKPLGEFHKDKSKKDGKSPRCKVCTRARYVPKSDPKPLPIDALNNKVCTSCLTEKPQSCFHKSKVGKAGRVPTCKTCKSSYDTTRYWEHPEKNRESARKYGRENREKIREYSKRWRDSRREHLSDYFKRYKRTDSYREYARNYERNRRRRDLGARLYNRMGCTLRRALRLTGEAKSSRSSEMLGYTSEMLRTRIEYQFQEGMSWDNYGDWHIDHKIPVARLLARGETRPHIINALSNLQPMWAEENMRKGARWVG